MSFVFLISLSLLIWLNSVCVLILIVIFFMAACDKCSFDHFQIIAEFYNNDGKSLSFLRSHSVLPSEIICQHCSSKFISVLGAVGSLVLFSESRFILVSFLGECPPPLPLIFSLFILFFFFFFLGGGRGGEFYSKGNNYKSRSKC